MCDGEMGKMAEWSHMLGGNRQNYRHSNGDRCWNMLPSFWQGCAAAWSSGKCCSVAPFPWLWATAGCPRWRMIHFWTGPPQKTSTFCAAARDWVVCGPCCCLRPCWCPWSLLLLETIWKSMICAAAGCYAQESFFCSGMIDCEWLRVRDIEGFCDTPPPKTITTTNPV